MSPPPLAILYLMISEFHSEKSEYKAKRESCFCNTAFVNLGISTFAFLVHNSFIKMCAENFTFWPMPMLIIWAELFLLYPECALHNPLERLPKSAEVISYHLVLMPVQHQNDDSLWRPEGIISLDTLEIIWWRIIKTKQLFKFQSELQPLWLVNLSSSSENSSNVDNYTDGWPEKIGHWNGLCVILLIAAVDKQPGPLFMPRKPFIKWVDYF